MLFDIYFPAAKSSLEKRLPNGLKIFIIILAEFSIPISSRIPIIFYATKTEFLSTNYHIFHINRRRGGFTESLHNRVAVPFEGSYGNLEEVLAHELTHAYLNAVDSHYLNVNTSLRPTSFPFGFRKGFRNIFPLVARTTIIICIY
jgi:hypothetical protein